MGQGVPHGPAVRPAGVAQAGAAVLGGGGGELWRELTLGANNYKKQFRMELICDDIMVIQT